MFIVAYAAQYVDDATSSGRVRFDNGASYSRTSSAHKMLDYRNFEELANQHVWLPFHFLPGNGSLPVGTVPPGTFIDRLICRPNSYPAGSQEETKGASHADPRMEEDSPITSVGCGIYFRGRAIKCATVWRSGRSKDWSEMAAGLEASFPERTVSSGRSARAADIAMSRYAEGDNSAFEEVYRDVVPRLRSFFLRHCPGQAEDILQQTFLSMHRARASFLPGPPVMPWAFAIARRRMIAHGRSHGRTNRVETAPSGSPSDAFAVLHQKRLQAELEEELNQLPPYQKEAFELIRLDGFTLEEAAAATGTSVSSIKARSHRAQETLRARLWRLVDR